MTGSHNKLVHTPTCDCYKCHPEDKPPTVYPKCSNLELELMSKQLELWGRYQWYPIY